MDLSLMLTKLQNQELESLRLCRDDLTRYGIRLSDSQLTRLQLRGKEALREAGRVELGPSILKPLLSSFCDSPYLDQTNCAETMEQLISLFYQFKTEADDLLTDDELLLFLKQKFNGVCGGSPEYLSDMTLEDLCRGTRYGLPSKDEEEGC